MYKKVSFEEAAAIISGDTSCVILDVREEEEFITGHASGAVLLPVDELDEVSARLAVPDKKQSILVYCRSGRRSLEAAEKLEALGYENIYDIGSLIGWPYGLE